MRLLDSDVKQFQRVYKKHFGDEVKGDEARRQLTGLVRQMEIVYQPITRAQLDRYCQKLVSESHSDERTDTH